ncbi:MAG: hypothetical protein DWQ36_18400 [Acidobacteria bacterium]|nr:MAG: hypothetical protein DWQ36_18400 [Acidobacteriota bacterium]
MVAMIDLAMPVLVSTLLVFFASFVLHAVLNWHWRDQDPLPDEEAVTGPIRTAGVPPGNYRFPFAPSEKEMRSPEMQKKFEAGPVGFLTLYPSGVPKMGKSLTQWFFYIVVVGVFVAYLASRSVAPGAAYLDVFQIVGTVAFLAYAGSEPIASIFYARKWSATLKNVVDGLIYGLLTAGSFAWLWPAV